MPDAGGDRPAAAVPTLVERARTLVHLGRQGALATVSRRRPGHPFASLMPYAPDERGRPLLLVSRLAVLSVGHPNTRSTRTMESREKAWYQLLFQFDEAEELFLRDDAKLFREWIGDIVDLEQYLKDLSRPGSTSATSRSGAWRWTRCT